MIRELKEEIERLKIGGGAISGGGGALSAELQDKMREQE
jgi:hypothetical protein